VKGEKEKTQDGKRKMGWARQYTRGVQKLSRVGGHQEDGNSFQKKETGKVKPVVVDVKKVKGGRKGCPRRKKRPGHGRRAAGKSANRMTRPKILKKGLPATEGEKKKVL